MPEPNMVYAGEDEPWSPTSIAFSLIAAQWAGITDRSQICDLGAGEAVSSLAIARRTRAHVQAVDSSAEAIAAMRSRSQSYEIGSNFNPVHRDVLTFLIEHRIHGSPFDLVLAEGGIAGVVGHRTLFEHARAVMAPGAFLVISGYVFNGAVESGSELDTVSVHVPLDVRAHYEKTRHANGRREILDEQQMLRLLQSSGFRILFNCRSGQNHWSSYFNRMADMCRKQIGAAKVYGSSERLVGSDEAFHNLRGQKYLSYAMIMAIRDSVET